MLLAEAVVVLGEDLRRDVSGDAFEILEESLSDVVLLGWVYMVFEAADVDDFHVFAHAVFELQEEGVVVPGEGEFTGGGSVGFDGELVSNDDDSVLRHGGRSVGADAVAVGVVV